MINKTLLIALLLATVGCRNVAIVSDSLFANNPLVSNLDRIEAAINDTSEENFVGVKHTAPGRTAYNTPFNQEIYSKGLNKAFSDPDVVVFSFATNDMNAVAAGTVSYESAYEAFWTLAHQAVQAGATCIVLAEWSHQFRSLSGGPAAPGGPFNTLMDQWFTDMHTKEGEQSYLGFDYTFVIADVSAEVESDLDRYIFDYIHPSSEGATLLADAVVQSLSACPEGRWIYDEGLKDGFELRVPWHLQ